MTFLQEMLYILDSMEEIKMRLLSDDYGKHLMGVEDLLQKHSLVEADINVLGDRVKSVVQNSQRFIGEEQEPGLENFRPADPGAVMERVTQLEEAYAELVKLAIERRTRLEESKKLWQFYWDMAEEENWIKEKENILSQGDIGHDLTTVHLLLAKQKVRPNILHGLSKNCNLYAARNLWLTRKLLSNLIMNQKSLIMVLKLILRARVHTKQSLTSTLFEHINVASIRKKYNAP